MLKHKKKIIVIDGQHLSYRAYYRFRGYRTSEGLASGLAYGVPFMVESLVRRFRADEVHIAFDQSKSDYRLAILPGYKDRPKKIDFDYKSFKSQLTDTMHILESMGCIVYYGGEADDTLYRIVRKQRKNPVYITLVSGDKDFVQMLAPKYKHKYVLKIYNPNKDVIVTPQNSLALYGYTPQECVDYLVLDGDKSDKVPGVRGYGKVKIRKFLDEHGSIEKYLSEWEDSNIQEAYIRNSRLIDLDLYYHEMGKDEPLNRLNKTPHYSQGAINKFAKKYELKVVLKEQFKATMGGLIHA